MNFPRTPGDSVCDAFRTAVETHGLSRVEVGAALATLLAGFCTVHATDEQIDAVMGLITDTVKVQIEEHRKMLSTMPPAETRKSPWAQA